MSPARQLSALLLLTWLLAACQPQPVREHEAEIPAEPSWPEYDFTAAAASGLRVYRLDPGSSQIDIVVRREGPMARLGHDHVVVARDVQAYLLLGGAIGDWRAELRFEASKLDIDPAEERKKYQLDTEPDADAIAGTRRNLLDKVLDAQQWPWLNLVVSDFKKENEGYSARLAFLVRDNLSESRHGFELVRSVDSVTVTGSVLLRQTELGLEPFSVLGGALSVADQLEVHLMLNGSALQ